MNWARGLFRLWLVASVLWAISILFAMGTFDAARVYLEGPPARGIGVTTSELLVSPIAEGLVTISFEGRSYQIDTGGVQPSDTDDWARLLSAAALQVNRDIALGHAKFRRARAEVITGVRIATLPLLILVLGASLLWALRGFTEVQKR